MWLVRDKALTNCPGPVSFKSIESNTTRRPFAYRALTPIMVKAMHVLSTDTRAKTGRYLKEHISGLENYAKYTCTSDEHLLDLIALTCFIWLSFFLTMLTARGLFGVLFEHAAFAQNAAGPCALLSITYLFKGGGHIFYDPPTVFLVSASIWMMTIQRWKLFYFTLIVALLNKETACIVSVAFFAYYLSVLPRKSLLKHLTAQCLLYVLLRVAIIAWLDPGTSEAANNNILRDYFGKNLMALWNARFWLDYVSQMALLGLVALICRRFADQPRLLRRSSLMSIPLMAGYFKSGLWGEVRVFYDIFPLLFLMGYKNLLELLGYRLVVQASEVGGTLLSIKAQSMAWSCIIAVIGIVLMASTIAVCRSLF